MKKALLFLLCVVLSPLLFAQRIDSTKIIYTVESVPNPKVENSSVSDPDKYLSEEDKAAIDAILNSLDDSTTAEIAVVVLGSIGEAVPKNFATELFNYWKIGKKGKDNGLLVLTVIDQRRTEFETGYGLEAVLPDVLCYRLGNQILVPQFKEGKYGTGLRLLAAEITSIISKNGEIEENTNTQTTSNQENTSYQQTTYSFIDELLHLFSPYYPYSFYFWICLLIGVVLPFVILAILKSKQDAYDTYMQLRNLKYLILIFIFPIPYLFVYIYLTIKLKQLRNEPRFSKINGLPMHKLGDKEEDQYLTSGQVKEEALRSVDYDVWITEGEDKDLLILRYDRRFSKYSNCKKCGFKAFSHDYSRTVVSPTYDSEGQGVTVRSCKHCNHTTRSTYSIARKTRPSESSSSSSSSSSYSSWSGGSSSYSSGSSGGSSSWGGGSSGGGGAGVSW